MISLSLSLISVEFSFAEVSVCGQFAEQWHGYHAPSGHHSQSQLAGQFGAVSKNWTPPPLMEGRRRRRRFSLLSSTKVCVKPVCMSVSLSFCLSHGIFLHLSGEEYSIGSATDLTETSSIVDGDWTMVDENFSSLSLSQSELEHISMELANKGPHKSQVQLRWVTPVWWM